MTSDQAEAARYTECPVQGQASVGPGALILARIRAGGDIELPSDRSALAQAAQAAAASDRRLGELEVGPNRTILVRGWLDDAAPNPNLHPSAPAPTLSPISNLVWAACLGAAWPEPESDPFPGHPFSRHSILTTCTDLGADRNTVVSALDTTLPGAGLVRWSGARGTLGPAAAALPLTTWAQLRRIHDRLPQPTDSDSASASDEQETGSLPALSVAGVRWLTAEGRAPASDFDTTVRMIVCALDMADGSVDRDDLPMLADPTIQSTVESTLAQSGRSLISLSAREWITGYPDPIAEALVCEGTGTLHPTQRAVLALVLIHTVAIPRSKNPRLDDRWTSKNGVQLDKIIANRAINRTAATNALRALRRAGFIASAQSGGYVPGPALSRLTAKQRNMLWEDMIVLGRPHGNMAQRIRDARNDVTGVNEGAGKSR
ncbi:hypothetical protein Aph01nite_29220 [Acrocarpospora phusangensis]|uniref:Uncharacterized protein n=1 Tax=Acrocarpospora phusangensis TaxID=1070424 RepID=A0A919QE53_9ACTN|nr:hypothetical protein Aph01nite_29220 [Acrocarpospora phusangensis]